MSVYYIDAYHFTLKLHTSVNTHTSLPSSFKLFDSNRSNIENKAAKALLNRFAYRYRLAKSFVGMNAPAVGKTLAGYDAILKLFLTYTAYEGIIKAANKLRLPSVGSAANNKVIDHALVKRIADNDALKRYLLTTAQTKNIRAVVENVLDGGNGDIVCLIFSLRNAFSHGDLTPTAIGINTKVAKSLLFDLSECLLAYCDNVFTACVDQVIGNAARSK